MLRDDERFGQVVVVRRGSAGRIGLGRERDVFGVLVGWDGRQRAVMLLEDDPWATHGYCTRRGDIGWWGADAVTKAAEV